MKIQTALRHGESVFCVRHVNAALKATRNILTAMKGILLVGAGTVET
jgi:isoaspartyl peptidase/L-asparaginase-like protein (Ntn-hydrolase superfamily)